MSFPGNICTPPSSGYHLVSGHPNSSQHHHYHQRSHLLHLHSHGLPNLLSPGTSSEGLYPHPHSSSVEPLRPVTIDESRTHCTAAFERLRVLREQGRFCDVILSTQGRQFPAHRCVLASCSSWFDSRLKVHKIVKEEIKIECHDLEVFYSVLTYFYTGQITIDRNSVGELLHLSDYFGVAKLKGHCCDFLLRSLSVKNVITLVQMGVKYSIPDLVRQCFEIMQKNFSHFLESGKMLSLSYNTVISFLSSEYVLSMVPQELILTFIANWVAHHPQVREDNFITLLVQFIDWNNLETNFLCSHLDKHQLYQTSMDALHNILHVVVKRNGINLGSKYFDLYQNLQDKLYPEQDLDELNDSNSFLSIAINSAVKDLEHSEVDTEWFLQNEPPSAPSSQPIPNPSTGAPLPSLSDQQYRGGEGQITNLVPVPQVSTSSTSNHTLNKQKLRDNLDFDIVEQVINEQRLSDENIKYKERDPSSSYVKRYDPKFRALTEVFRQETDDGEDALGMSYAKYGQEISGEVKNTKQDSRFSAAGQWSSPIPNADPPNLDNNFNQQHEIIQQQIHPQHANCSEDVGMIVPPPTPIMDPNFQVNPLANEEMKIKLERAKEAQESLEDAQPAKNGSNKESVQKQHVRKAKLLAEHRSLSNAEETDKKKRKKRKISDSHVSSMTYKCPDCSYETKVSSRMKVHCKQHQTNTVYHCEFCDFKSNWKKETWDHIRQNHIPGPPYHCDYANCGYNSQKLYKVLYHRKTHSDTFNFKCHLEDCKFVTKTKERLQTHIDMHDKKFPCQKCDKVCSSEGSLKSHMISHTEEKKFTCKECNFKTKYKSHLSLHARIHLGTAYKCDFKDCCYVTPKMSLMLAHKRAHFKEKIFKCNQCDKSFVENSQLKRHKNIHSNEMPFECHICPYKTKRKDKLKSHLLKVHKSSDFRI